LTYDTIIIGAGLSGLAAGIRLAYFEKSVCVLERHTTIGGLNSFYRLRHRDHDVGLHAVTNFAAPGTKKGPLSKLLRQLRLRWDDFDLRPQVGSVVAFPDQALHFTNELEVLRGEIADKFPDQIDGFQRLLARIDEYNELDLEQEQVSAREVVGQYLSDPVLVDMLFCPLLYYSCPTPNDTDFTQFVIMFKSIFYEGFGRPPGGVRPIMKALVRKYRSLDGELRLRAGVESIRIENGRATGVVLDNGELIEAKNVLSTAGVVETLAMCPSSSRDDVPTPRSGEISFVEAIFSLDCNPRELKHEPTIVFFNDSDRFLYEKPNCPVDVRSGVICSPNNFQYDKSTGEDGRIRVTALANADYWMSLPSEEAYVAAKESWCDQMIQSVIRFVPDFRDHIVDTAMFTPRTITKFTGHVNGSVYGSPDKVPDGRLPFENLYLCGTDHGFLGIVGSMLSGISIANRYLLQSS
jgi:phytoene dehydrogenase-like protein